MPSVLEILDESILVCFLYSTCSGQSHLHIFGMWVVPYIREMYLTVIASKNVDLIPCHLYISQSR